MNIHGSRTLDAPRGAVFDAIFDPTTLLGVIPGCRAIERIDDVEYRGQISLRLPGLVGTWQTVVRVVETRPPASGRLDGEIVGALGSVKGSASFQLEDADGRTVVAYDGQAAVGGPLSRLDTRFVEGLARSLVNQGLGNLESRLRGELVVEAAADRRPGGKEVSR